MERSDSLAGSWPLVLFGVAGVTAATLFSGRAPAPGLVAPTPPRVESRQETPAAPAASLGVRPALEILAEHLGVSPDAGQRSVTARLMAEEIRARGIKEPKDVQAEADLMLDDAGPRSTRDEGDHPPPVDAVRSGAQGPGQRATAGASRPAHPRAFDPGPAGRRAAPAGPAAPLPDEPGCVAGQPQARPGRRGPRPRRCPELLIVIATMPDYVDSYSAWTFDRNLDGIQRAAGAMSYASTGSTSRTGIPTPRRASSGRAPRVRAGRHPVSGLRSGGARRLLLVLMPLETATAGIQKRAFLSAAALAHELTPDRAAPRPRPFLLGLERLPAARDAGGPAAGSGPERGRLRSWCDRGAPRVAATRGCSRAPTARRPIPGHVCTTALVDFQATTVSDDDTMRALAHFLGTIKARMGRRIGRGDPLRGEHELRPGLLSP